MRTLDRFLAILLRWERAWREHFNAVSRSKGFLQLLLRLEIRADVHPYRLPWESTYAIIIAWVEQGVKSVGPAWTTVAGRGNQQQPIGRASPASAGRRVRRRGPGPARGDGRMRRRGGR